ncbi:MAG: hypothetical protein AAF628_10525 [Planctomycetota bacterium]
MNYCRHLLTWTIRVAYVVVRVVFGLFGSVCILVGALDVVAPPARSVFALGFMALGLLLAGTPRLWATPRGRVAGVLSALVMFAARVRLDSWLFGAFELAIVAWLCLLVVALDRAADGWPFRSVIPPEPRAGR